MAKAFKGNNTTTSLVPEDNGWGQPPSTYAGGRMFQNNDGTFNTARNTLQSEARTPNSELSGLRLGNRNVSGSFVVEIDPENYNQLLESTLYGRFQNKAVTEVLTGASIVASSAYQFTLTMPEASVTSLDVTVGDMLVLSNASLEAAQVLEGTVVVTGKTATSLTLMCPEQSEPALDIATDITVSSMDILRPSKTIRSFNAEETLYAEDGTVQRFMTSGAVSTSAAFELPSDGTIKTTFSLLGKRKFAGSEYETADVNLTNGEAAHTSPIDHKNYDPMVLQDGKIISEDTNTLCQVISGNLTIENGTEVNFTGCSYDPQSSVSGNLSVTVNFEVLFESDQDFRDFENEVVKKLMIRLKDRNTGDSLLIYLPATKTTTYNVNNSQGLVTASLTAMATIDPDAINSIVIGTHYG